MSFLAPWSLLGLVAVPCLGVAWWLLLRQPPSNPLGSLRDERGRPPRRRFMPAVMALLGLLALLTGAARPEAEIDLPRVEGTVILIFDASTSMLAGDVDPSRLDVAKAAAHQFVSERPADVEIGVVTFADGGNVTLAPTDDRAAISATIDRISADGGTSIARGVFGALNAVSDEPLVLTPDRDGELPSDIGFFGSSIFLLFSDGEQLEGGEIADVATLTANAGVRVFSLGVGTTEGTVVEADGFNLSTVLDETVLQELADATDGAYQRIDANTELGGLYEEVDRRLTVEGEPTEITSLFAAAGALLLLGAAVMSARFTGRMP